MDYNAEAKRLNAERMTVWEENKRLLDDTKGQFDEAQKTEWDRRDARMNELAAQRDTMLDAAKRELEAGQLREAEAEVFGDHGSEKKARSEQAEFRAWVQGREVRRGGDWENPNSNVWSVDLRGAAQERDLLRRGASPAEIRSLLWDADSSGSTVPTTLSRTLYEYMEASIAALRMPTTKLTTDSGEEMNLLREASYGAGTAIIPQGTAITGTDPAFNRVPLNAYKFGKLLQESSEVIQDSGIDMVSYAGRNIGKAVGRLIDQYLILGTGTGQPLGMAVGLTVGGGGTVATGGTIVNPKYETLVDLVYSVNDEYRASGDAGFLMRDATAGVLRKLRDGAGGTEGAVLWEPSLTAGIQNGQPDRLLGFPVWTDPNVAAVGSAAVPILFGDWSCFVVRLTGNLVIERSDDFAFSTDLVTFRGKQRIDSDYRDLTGVNRMRMHVT